MEGSVLIDYHVHALAHGEFEYSPDWIREFLSKARKRKISQIGFSEHDWFLSRIDFKAIREVASEPEYQNLITRIGVEVDYKPDRELEIKSFLGDKPYDFAIGSVHHLGDWPFDHPDHKDEFVKRSTDEIYQEYYALVRQVVRSKLFDIVGHIDLIKVWGNKPCQKHETSFLKPLLSDIKDSGMVVEINSGGLRKPVNEIYPSDVLLKELFAYDIPITFGSDAHHPNDLGEGLSIAVQKAWEIGYRTMVGFSQRKHMFYPITRLG